MPLDMWGHLLEQWRAKQWRAMLPAAMICRSLHNVNGGKGKNQPFEIADFIGCDPSENPHDRAKREADALAKRFEAFVNGTS